MRRIAINIKVLYLKKLNMRQAKFDKNKSETHVLYCGLIGVTLDNDWEFLILKNSLKIGNTQATMMPNVIIKTTIIEKRMVVETATERIVTGVEMSGSDLGVEVSSSTASVVRISDVRLEIP